MLLSMTDRTSNTMQAIRHTAFVALLALGVSAYGEALPTVLHTAEVVADAASFDSADPPGKISDVVRGLRRSVVATDDARGQPFAVIDKKMAALHIFDAAGKWIGTTPILLGSAAGDHTVPGVGDKPLQHVLPHERTTPAGRFVAETGRNARNEEVIWIDYDAGVSIHPVLTTNASERRLERLKTPTADDNRVSYGCVNVPTVFYNRTVLPQLRRPGAIVYVIPEVLEVDQVFAGIVGQRAEVDTQVMPRKPPVPIVTRLAPAASP